MSNVMIQNLEKMLANGKDSALLRFSLGNEYAKQDDAVNATIHFEQAIKLDPQYSAAWKNLGKALESSGRVESALQTYREGIEVATHKGDKQTAKEMQVFANRIEKQLAANE